MRLVVAGSLFAYILAFFLLQSIIGNYRGARNIGVRPKPELLRMVLINVAMVFIFVFVLTAQHSSFNNLTALRVAGFAVVLLGLGLSMWSQYALGPNWVGGVALQPKHKLITTGPFKYVRHPMYSGIWISCFGICLVSLNVFYGLAALTWALAFSTRIVHEDEMLKKKFKRRYDEYAAHTGALVPRFRRKS